MSLDSLGRVIVGSGHFADQTPHVMESVSRFMGDERTISNIENASSHVEVGVRNIWTSAKKLDQFLGDKLYKMRFPEQSPSVHVDNPVYVSVDNPDYSLLGRAKRLDQFLGDKLYKMRFPSNPDQKGNRLVGIMERTAREEAAHQKAAENLEKLGEAGKDFLEAFGWGGAGDLESATTKTVDGAVKMAEVFWNGLKGPSGD